MVSSADPEATAAGVRVLEAGGNAFDAAVAVAATLGVAEPMNSGIGGYGTIPTYSARDKRVRFLNSSGRIPRGVNSDAFRAPAPDFEANRRGAKAVSTPGNVAAWAALSREYGSAEWSSLFRDAILLADRGFPTSSKTAEVIRAAFGWFSAEARGFYGLNGEPLPAGASLVQRDLARSLTLIARDGDRAIGDGPLGAAIDSTMREAGSFLRATNLRANVADWSDAIFIDYRGAMVYTAPPPANAFDYLVRLGLMAQLDVRGLGHNSASYLHQSAEVTKHAFGVRLRHAGDPEISPPPLSLLLSTAYWVEQARALSLDRASQFKGPAASPASSENTTHFVVADAAGNIVSATQTLGNLFGSRIMPAGTGVWLNNSLAYSTFEPKGNPMDAHPGRRKLSGDCPTIIFRDGRPFAALGTPGGHTIGQTVAQMVMNLVDFNMIDAAIDTSRVSFIELNQLAVDDGVPAPVRSALAGLGPDVVIRQLGDAHGMTVEHFDAGRLKRLVGAADCRGEGAARGHQSTLPAPRGQER
jgi:gamma-glutamyltranspeptidase/glutathione hydrolase